MLFLQVLFLCVSFISAQHFSNNPCPERPVQQDFDLSKVSNFRQLKNFSGQKSYFRTGLIICLDLNAIVNVNNLHED